jgi:pimeloyl-ACP methyl ester carboxylesterase
MLMLGYLYLAQRSFIYFPGYTNPVAITPNFELENDGLLLKGWVLNRGKKEAILYFGGNGESVEHNLPLFSKLFADKTVYMLSYRGYGESEGEPTERGIYADVLALYDGIRNEHKSISVIGRSLGSGVATYVAASRDVDRVALITPYASIEELAQEKFPFFPIGLLLKDRYQSAEHAKRIESDVLVLYASNDQVIPESSTKKLIAGFRSEQIEVVKINDAGHNSISEFDNYHTELHDFFMTTSNMILDKDN